VEYALVSRGTAQSERLIASLYYPLFILQQLTRDGVESRPAGSASRTVAVSAVSVSTQPVPVSHVWAQHLQRDIPVSHCNAHFLDANRPILGLRWRKRSSDMADSSECIENAVTGSRQRVVLHRGLEIGWPL